MARNGKEIPTTGRDISRGIPINIYLSAMEELAQENEIAAAEKERIAEEKRIAAEEARIRAARKRRSSVWQKKQPPLKRQEIEGSTAKRGTGSLN